jgi:hypothetical protein
VPGLHSFDYAVIRIVPRVERGECVNVGIVLFCRTVHFLAAGLEPDWARIATLSSGQVDRDDVQRQLDYISQVCTGDPAAGPIAALSQSERFHYLVAPRSTIIQPSPVHSGLCDEPAAALEHLMDGMVR